MIATLTPIGIVAVSGAGLAFLGSCLLLSWAFLNYSPHPLPEQLTTVLRFAARLLCVAIAVVIGWVFLVLMFSL